MHVVRFEECIRIAGLYVSVDLLTFISFLQFVLRAKGGIVSDEARPSNQIYYFDEIFLPLIIFFSS